MLRANANVAALPAGQNAAHQNRQRGVANLDQPTQSCASNLERLTHHQVLNDKPSDELARPYIDTVVAGMS